MKFSEAILLGSGIVAPYYQGTFDYGRGGNFCGACYVGTALLAIGITREKWEEGNLNAEKLTLETWPWLRRRNVPCPVCEKAFDIAVFDLVYAHLGFGNEGECKRNRPSREELVDWISAIEPDEEESSVLLDEQFKVLEPKEMNHELTKSC